MSVSCAMRLGARSRQSYLVSVRMKRPIFLRCYARGDGFLVSRLRSSWSFAIWEDARVIGAGQLCASRSFLEYFFAKAKRTLATKVYKCIRRVSGQTIQGLH